MITNIINGARVIDAYAGMECKVNQGPSPEELMDPEFLKFLAIVLDIYGEKIANSKMTTKSIRKFAKTKHKNLPDYVREKLST